MGRFTALIVLAALLLFGHDDPPAKLEFFSGIVKLVDEDRVLVNRVLAGKQPQTREFYIYEDTRIEGTLKPDVRVTVGFTSEEDGDYAARIIVRADAGRH